MKLKDSFLLLILLQGAHAIEEYIFHFYEVFPLAAILNDLLSGSSRTFFIAFNAMLLAFGLYTYWRLNKGARRSTRALVAIWIAIELSNGIAHIVWAIMIRTYNPGLVTGPLLLIGTVYLAYRLYHARRP